MTYFYSTLGWRVLVLISDLHTLIYYTHVIYFIPSAKRNINLNDEDKLELLDNVTLKGMKGDIDLIEVN